MSATLSAPRLLRCAPLSVYAALLGACAGSTSPDGARVEIAVRPLELAGVGDARYTVAVTTATGDTVWSRELASSDYGDGRGALAYVGPCDASPEANPNTVTLTITALLDEAGEPLAAGSWRDPGPLSQAVACAENADAPVTFDLTILRAANQGFFDVAVTFDDIFCSAKLDCVDALLHDPTTGGRGPTAAIAFACTAGPDQDTTLYWGDAAIVCRDGGGAMRATYPVDPTLGRGQHGPLARVPAAAPDAPPGVFESAVYTGAETLPGLDKCYWNLALGLDPAGLGPDCAFEATATAAASPFVAPAFHTPPGTIYPVIRWAVPLTDAAGALTCGAHALDAPDGLVATEYAPMEGLPFTAAASCAELAEGMTATPEVAVDLSVVDETGAALPALALTLESGSDVPLPGALTMATGGALAGHIVACDGVLVLPDGLVPQADTTLTVTLPSGATTTASTPGVAAVVFVVPQFHPVAWWRFENTTSYSALARDQVYGWICENGAGPSRSVPGAVGLGVDLVSLPSPSEYQCYTRLTAAGLPFSNDARMPQRAWVASDSFTVETMFEDTRMLQVGTPGALFWLSTRLVVFYAGNQFRITATRADGTTAAGAFALDGIAERAEARYREGWHHVAVTYERSTGELRLYLDGVNPDGFVMNVGAGTALHTGTNLFIGGGVFNPTDASIDEFAGYVGALSPGLIHQHAVDAIAGLRPYGACERTQAPWPTDLADPAVGGIDPRSLAPGYPDFDAQGGNPDARTPLQQLQYYQLPRYAAGSTLPRMSSWMGGAYIAGQGTGVSGTALGQAQVDIMEELASFWNYTVKVSDNVGRSSPVAAQVALANTHPEWPTFAITMWPQISPIGSAAALDATDTAYLASKGMSLMSHPFVSGSTAELSLDHFPNDGTTPLSTTQSPTSPLHTWEIDGKVIDYRLAPFLTALAPREAAGANRLDHINENGEVVGTHYLSTAVLAADPTIATDLAAYDPTAIDLTTTPPTVVASKAALYLGRAEAKINNAYFAAMRARPELANTTFTWYGLDGDRNYRPRWEEVRQTMTQVDGSWRPTPDLYPRVQKWVRNGAGAWHGFTWLGNARRYEIAAGDKLYWPFLAAGWANDPATTILPGEWLGLLKVVAALGADSWYPAFFSLQSPFPEPEGWVWQAAMPAYAQAITSRYEDLLRQGDLVLARASYIPQAVNWWHFDFYSLYTKAPTSELVVARRLGDEWLFAGVLVPTSNAANVQPLVRDATIFVDWDGDGVKDEITLPMRRQGAVYRWDRSVTPPTLVQLDRWHEPWHPFWWSRDFLFDAEVHDGLTAGANGEAWTIYTDAPNAPDYRGFTTSLRVEPADATTWAPVPTGATLPLADAPAARYAFQPRETVDLHAWIRARVRDDGDATAWLTLDEGGLGEQRQAIAVSGDGWAWYHLDGAGAAAVFTAVAPSEHLAPTSGPHVTTEQVVTLRPGSAQLEIDLVLFSTSATRDPSTEPPESALTEQGTLP